MLYSLQIGRAIAALMVIGTHSLLATNSFLQPAPEFISKILMLGALGVNYFFVLSGFIIAYATTPLSHKINGCIYYAKSRIIRIYAPYLPVALCLLIALTYIPQLSGRGAGDVSVWGTILLIPSEQKLALSIGWTLQHEVLFYLLFGICHFALKNWRYIYLWIIPITAGHFFHIPVIVEVATSPMNANFLFGLLAYEALTKNIGSKHRRSIFMAGIALVLIYSIITLIDPNVINKLFAGIGFAYILLAAIYYEKTIRFARFKNILFLGTASYAIYLAHNPVISVIARVLNSVSINTTWWLSIMILFAAAITSGCAYHLIIERPAIKLLKKWLM